MYILKYYGSRVLLREAGVPPFPAPDPAPKMDENASRDAADALALLVATAAAAEEVGVFAGEAETGDAAAAAGSATGDC